MLRSLALPLAPLCRYASTLPSSATLTAPAIGKLIPDGVITHGEGTYLHLSDGRKILDFACGIAVTNTGHCHPKVVSAIQEQAGKILHAQMNVAHSSIQIDLIDRLRKVVPYENPGFFFANSGAEAVENAIKIARLHTKRPNVIVLQHSFHGRTIGALSMTTSKAAYRAGLAPLMAGVHTIAAPYCLHCNGCVSEGNDCCGRPIADLRTLLKTVSPASETAAVVIEPVLGEGGYVVPPPSFLKELREICTENEILLVADEVQSGFGRTGKYFAYEHFLERKEAPDMILMAKGIASGMPLSAIACHKDILDSAPKGSIGGTYGGNAVACAAAVATMDVIEEEKLLENSFVMGERLRAGLTKMKEQHEEILDVRGLGLMNAIEFASGKDTEQFAGAISAAVAKKDMLLMPTGTYDTMRFMPPLNVSKKEVDTALEKFEEAFLERKKEIRA